MFIKQLWDRSYAKGYVDPNSAPYKKWQNLLSVHDEEETPKNECIMNEKGILKSGNTTLEKRDSDAVFRKCISNIWIVSRNLLWDDFS